MAKERYAVGKKNSAKKLFHETQKNFSNRFFLGYVKQSDAQHFKNRLPQFPSQLQTIEDSHHLQSDHAPAPLQANVPTRLGFCWFCCLFCVLQPEGNWIP